MGEADATVREEPRVTRPSLLKRGWAFGIYIILDLACIGLGMGVPVASILLGAAVGWYAARAIAGCGSSTRPMALRESLVHVLLYAAATSGVTFAVMGAIWGRCVVLLFDPLTDLARFGHPLILYEPKASFIGWLMLMILVAPFLQFLMTLFGAHVTLLWLLRTGSGGRGGR
jgi:hypothetical protein